MFDDIIEEIKNDILKYGRADVCIVHNDGNVKDCKVFSVENGELFCKEFGGCEFYASLDEINSMDLMLVCGLPFKDLVPSCNVPPSCTDTPCVRLP